MISIKENLKAIEKAEMVTQNKQKKINKLHKKLRTNRSVVLVETLEEALRDKEGSQFDMDV